jgi:hypothetical protein
MACLLRPGVQRHSKIGGIWRYADGTSTVHR